MPDEPRFEISCVAGARNMHLAGLAPLESEFT